MIAYLYLWQKGYVMSIDRLRPARMGQLITALFLALVMSSPTLVLAKANNSKRPSQPAIAIRLADLWGAGSQRTERQRWQIIAHRLKNSDPLADAKRDLALGIRGLVALRSTTWNLEHVAPGIVCKYEDSLHGHIIYTLAHGDYLTPYLAAALSAYRDYAATYNYYIVSVGRLKPEACEIDAE